MSARVAQAIDGVIALPQQRLLLARRLRQPPGAVAGETTVLISVKPHYARLIETGEKRVEFRRRFPREVTGGRAIFYVSTPVRRIAMAARIARVVRGTPAVLWREFGEVGGTTRGAFDTYFTGARTGVALVLEEVRVLRPGIALADPGLRAAGFRPPQSVAVLAAESGVGKLVDESKTTRGEKDRWCFLVTALAGHPERSEGSARNEEATWRGQSVQTLRSTSG